MASIDKITRNTQFDAHVRTFIHLFIRKCIYTHILWCVLCGLNWAWIKTHWFNISSLWSHSSVVVEYALWLMIMIRNDIFQMHRIMYDMKHVDRLAFFFFVVKIRNIHNDRNHAHFIVVQASWLVKLSCLEIESSRLEFMQLFGFFILHLLNSCCWCCNKSVTRSVNRPIWKNFHRSGNCKLQLADNWMRLFLIFEWKFLIPI